MSGIGMGLAALSPLKKIVAGGAAFLFLLLALALILRSCDKKEQRHENQLVTQGAQQERGRQNEETFNAVLNASRPITDAERNVVCSRYDRNRAANCP